MTSILCDARRKAIVVTNVTQGNNASQNELHKSPTEVNRSMKKSRNKQGLCFCASWRKAGRLDKKLDEWMKCAV